MLGENTKPSLIQLHSEPKALASGELGIYGQIQNPVTLQPTISKINNRYSRSISRNCCATCCGSTLIFQTTRHNISTPNAVKL